jgi:spermidine synthase/MFS family permease
MKQISTSTIKGIIAILFITSGAAGLIYQVVWFKYLALFIGNTTYAQMIVLATFLGGLAAGNFFIGRKADNFKNPVRVYGILEIAIGLYCLLYPSLNIWLGNIFQSLVTQQDLENQNLLFTIIRFLLAALLLFIPTVAMGGTLPVLSKYYVEDVKNARRETAILYFLNSFGAVGGTFFAGFILIKEFGLNSTIYITAILNAFIGIFAVIMSFLFKPTAKQENKEASNEQSFNHLKKNDFEINKNILKIIVLIAGTSGMAALLYEMVWTRLLVNVLGSSTYAFSIMLMAFIAGITCGSLIVSNKFLVKYDKIKLLTFCQAAIGITTMAVLPIYERLPYYFWKTSSFLVKSESTFAIFLTSEFVLCFLIIFLPTIFGGMSLPIAVEIVSRMNNKISFSVGRIFSINTLGTVIGVLLTTLIFIPAFGIKTTFEIGILINLFGAAVLILYYKKILFTQKILMLTMIFAAFVGYLILIPAWNYNSITSGVFRKIHETPPESYNEFISKLSSERKILFYEEGISATVAVYEKRDSIKQRILIVNGKPDASSYLDMPTQVLLGQIPMMLHPNPKNIFVIGVGSGVTIGSVLTHPINKVTAVEISPEVVKAAEYFNRWNNNYAKDPRCKLVVEDAHTFLKLTKEKYDIIISEPSNPWIAGIGNLFSIEYFERCKERLNKDGILLQWFHIYEQNDEIVKLVFATFNKVFPTAQLWMSMFDDVMMVGSEKEIQLDYALLKKKFNEPQINSDFKKIEINSVFEFLTCQAYTEEGFSSIAESKFINTETHPILEFIAPKSFYLEQTSKLVYQHDERFSPLAKNLLVSRYVDMVVPTADEIYSAASYQFDRAKNNRLSYGLTKYLLTKTPNDYLANTLNFDAAEKIFMTLTRSSLLEKIMNLFPDSQKVVYEYANEKIKENVNASTFLKIFSIDEFAKMIGRVANKDTVTIAKMNIQLASVYLQNGEWQKADSLCSIVDKILTLNPNIGKSIPADEYAFVYSTTSMIKNDFRKSIEYAMALTLLNPKHPLKTILFKRLKWRMR